MNDLKLVIADNRSALRDYVNGLFKNAIGVTDSTIHNKSESALPKDFISEAVEKSSFCIIFSSLSSYEQDAPAASEQSAKCQNDDKATDNESSLINEILKQLKHVGINHINSGSHYLRYAIKLCIEDKRYLDSFTKELYPAVAKAFKTTSTRVERSIRYLLQISWENGAGYSYSTAIGLPGELGKKPTNSQFIYQMVDLYKSKLLQENK